MNSCERWIAAFALLFLMAACQSTPPPSGEPVVTVETILAQPAEHTGRTVTISAAVARPFGTRWFTVSSMGGMGDLLIYKGGAGQESTPSVSPHDLVRVHGTVREYKAAAIRQQEGDSFANDLAGYTGKVMVEASQIQMLPE